MQKITEIDNFQKRLLMCVLGVVICAVSVGFFKMAAFGVDPFQAFMAGLSSVIPIPFGTLYVIANVILLLFALVADRHYIGLATVVNLFLVGYIVDYSHRVLRWLLPDIGMPGRILCLLIAIVIMCLASSFYFTADLGVSTYDAVALIITGTWHRGQFRWVRIVTDLVCVLAGISLYLLSGGSLSGIGAVAGVGTIITAFFMGPLIDFFNRRVAQPFLQGKSHK
ncbi:MAG: hypothetical protein LUI13_02730 [Lachnospiraceae bacterium]|nr:hypothetical protein [Lachnospiraceae bacterium]